MPGPTPATTAIGAMIVLDVEKGATEEVFEAGIKCFVHWARRRVLGLRSWYLAAAGRREEGSMYVERRMLYRRNCGEEEVSFLENLI